VRTAPRPPAPFGKSTTFVRLSPSYYKKIIKHAACERDQLMILVAYRHGLRVSELVHLRWSQVDLDTHRLRVNRLKNGEPSVHPLSGREIWGLRKLRRQQPAGSRYVFGHRTRRIDEAERALQTPRKDGRQSRYRRCPSAPVAARNGFRLVNDGLNTLSLAAYLGHANIQNTKRYAKMDARRFDGL
jgi:integrase